MTTRLIMPMGGAGTRLSMVLQNEKECPKPMIEIYGKPFYYWAVMSVMKYVDVDKLSFIVLQEHVDKYEIDKQIKSYFPNATIAVLPQQLNGPVLTSKFGVENLDIGPDEELLFNDCDHLFKSDDLTKLIQAGKNFNGLMTFESDQPQFSYAILNKKGEVVGTREKEVVSNRAICGLYAFENKQTFMDCWKSYDENGLGNYKEFFMSGLYNYMNGRKVEVMNIDVHVSFGTLDEFKDAKSEENKRCFEE